MLFSYGDLAMAVAMDCDLQAYENKTYEQFDMDDDPLFTEDSFLFNDSVWGVEFADYDPAKKQLKGEIIFSEPPSEGESNQLVVTSYRNSKSGRCTWKIARSSASGEVVESFELIAKIGDSTLWFGDKNKMGGEIFSYLEQTNP